MKFHFSNLPLISGSSSPLNKLGSPLCPNYSSLMWGLGSPLVPHLGRDLPHLPSSPPSLPPHLLPSWCLHSLLLHSQANLLAHHLSLQSAPIQGMTTLAFKVPQFKVWANIQAAV